MKGIIELAPLLRNWNIHSGNPKLNAKLDCGFVARISRKHFLQLQQSLGASPVVVAAAVFVMAAAVAAVAAVVVVEAEAVVMVPVRVRTTKRSNDKAEIHKCSRYK